MMKSYAIFEDPLPNQMVKVGATTDDKPMARTQDHYPNAEQSAKYHNTEGMCVESEEQRASCCTITTRRTNVPKILRLGAVFGP